MKYIFFLVLVLVLLSCIAKAHNSLRDTSFIDRALDNNLTRVSLVTTPLFLQGLKMSHEKIDFSNFRDIHYPNFHTSIDNYTQYFPLALTFGLKLSGVESKSSWKRLLAATFFVMLIDNGTVKIMKTLIHAKRPDFTGNNSFPSGHTAQAFMSAHMFVKEYAMDNYFYSTLAYLMATFTGTMRVMNNRHWMSDVLAGASIGLFSTELAYFCSDLLFKYKEEKYDFKGRNPFFIGLQTSYNLSFNEYHNLSENRSIKFLNGASTGIHTGYFYNKYLGSGIYADYSNYRYFDPNAWEKKDISFYYIGANQYFSLPLHSRIILASHLGLGYTYSEHYKRFPIKISRQENLRYEVGASLSLLLTSHTAIRFFASYTNTKLEIENNFYPFQTLNFGNTIAITF
ncbi:MAG: phosphatase PAP2 family protein [Bacteroidota bacterium]|nr:phosphatase PAP2 family protein [Bacteroidota bacterium]